MICGFQNCFAVQVVCRCISISVWGSSGIGMNRLSPLRKHLAGAALVESERLV